MKVSEKIIDKIKNDGKFRIELAAKLGVQENSVRYRASKNTKLDTDEAIKFYESKGYTKKQIFNNL